MRGLRASGWCLAVAIACGACTSILGDFSTGAGSADGGIDSTTSALTGDSGPADASTGQADGASEGGNAAAPDGPATDAPQGSGDDSADDAGVFAADASCEGGPCVAQITANGNHSCALMSDQTVRCWGDNLYGESLWNGTMPDVATPTTVTGFGPARAVRAGDRFTCVNLVDESVWCWGDNASDMLGVADAGIAPDAGPDAARIPSPPVQVLPPGSTSELLVGGYHACALATGDAGVPASSVICWGQNGFGQVGVAGAVFSVAPPVVVSTLTSVNRVTLGSFETCVTRSVAPFGECIGDNSYGQLGRGTTADASGMDNLNHPTPAAVQFGNWGAIVNFSHSCGNQMGVTLTSGDIALWGDNTFGQLGPQFDGGSSATPMLVPAFDEVTQLSLLQYSSCALRSDGTVWSWGSTAYGQTGNTANVGSIQVTPAQVTGITTATQISGGLNHACALLANGTVQCWGDNQSQQLGRSTGTASFSATAAPVQF